MRKILPLAVLFACWPSAAAPQHLHPKLKSKELSVSRVAVLPVRAEVAKSGVKGGESMLQESEALALDLHQAVTRVLGAHGFTVVEDPVTTAESGTGAEESANARREAVASLQSRFDALAPQLLSKPKDVTKGRFSMGDEINALVSDRVEALVFVRGNGVVFTKGKRFLQGGLLGMAAGPKGQFRCDVVIVDARSGDVLFLSRIGGDGDLTKEAGRRIEKPFSKHLKKVATRS
jgi:hypothetical protein